MWIDTLLSNSESEETACESASYLRTEWKSNLVLSLFLKDFA